MRLLIFQLLESNLHIGHRSIVTSKLNSSAIYCFRNKYSVFDLEQAVYVLKKALDFIKITVSSYGKLLFSAVTPSRALQRYVLSFSKKIKQPAYCISRWEGGFLTNWNKIRSLRIRQMRNITGYLNPANPQQRRYNRYKYYIYMLARKERMYKDVSLSKLNSKKFFLQKTKSNNTNNAIT